MWSGFAGSDCGDDDDDADDDADDDVHVDENGADNGARECSWLTYECGGDTFGDPTFEDGADLDAGMCRDGGGGGSKAMESSARSSRAAAAAQAAAMACWARLLRLEFGLLWILECRVSSSDRLKRLEQPGKWQACGFSPVWVRMCLVWCSSRWKALSHSGHLYGRGRSARPSLDSMCDSLTMVDRGALPVAMTPEMGLSMRCLHLKVISERRRKKKDPVKRPMTSKPEMRVMNIRYAR